jgi:glucuronate isomerase
MKQFIGQDFLLNTATAKRLYHDYVENLPLIDYHCHLSPKEIYEDRSYENITQLWLGADHYKWRLMRANGIEEKYITGNASDEEKFEKWAQTIEGAIGNPLYHWSHLELKKYFGYEGVLTYKTAKDVWSLCNEKLKQSTMSARNLILQSNVKVICTTDDPADDLSWHKRLREDDFKVKVLPTFRPDLAIAIEKTDFTEYIQRLSRVSGVQITDFRNLVKALNLRMDVFGLAGCCISDHGLSYIMYETFNNQEIERIFDKRMHGKVLCMTEIRKYKTALLIELGKSYAERNWVMQLHYGVQRDLNSCIFEKLGADAGIDAIDSKCSAVEMGQFLNVLCKQHLLPKTIIYSLNPMDDAIIDTVIGCFQDSSQAGKIQHGSAWWFNDHITGMKKQMTSLANTGLLKNFVGMLTDSRSFISYARHEYFRRILCQMIGEWVENGEYPNDDEQLKSIVENIAYYNAKKYFGFE